MWWEALLALYIFKKWCQTKVLSFNFAFSFNFGKDIYAIYHTVMAKLHVSYFAISYLTVIAKRTYSEVKQFGFQCFLKISLWKHVKVKPRLYISNDFSIILFLKTISHNHNSWPESFLKHKAYMIGFFHFYF